MLFAMEAYWIMPSLFNHIRAIVGLRATEQMFRVKAGRIVTGVQRAFSIGKWTLKSFKGDAAYQLVTGFLADLTGSSANHPIPTLVFIKRPQQAGIGIAVDGNGVNKILEFRADYIGSTPSKSTCLTAALIAKFTNNPTALFAIRAQRTTLLFRVPSFEWSTTFQACKIKGHLRASLALMVLASRCWSQRGASSILCQ